MSLEPVDLLAAAQAPWRSAGRFLAGSLLYLDEGGSAAAVTAGGLPLLFELGVASACELEAACPEARCTEAKSFQIVMSLAHRTPHSRSWAAATPCPCAWCSPARLRLGRRASRPCCRSGALAASPLLLLTRPPQAHPSAPRVAVLTCVPESSQGGRGAFAAFASHVSTPPLPPLVVHHCPVCVALVTDASFVLCGARRDGRSSARACDSLAALGASLGVRWDCFARGEAALALARSVAEACAEVVSPRANAPSASLVLVSRGTGCSIFATDSSLEQLMAGGCGAVPSRVDAGSDAASAPLCARLRLPPPGVVDLASSAPRSVRDCAMAARRGAGDALKSLPPSTPYRASPPPALPKQRLGAPPDAGGLRGCAAVLAPLCSESTRLAAAHDALLAAAAAVESAGTSSTALSPRFEDGCDPAFVSSVACCLSREPSPAFAHVPSSLGALFGVGASLLGLQCAAAPGDAPLVVLFVIGGVAPCEIAHAARASALAAGQAAQGGQPPPRLVVGGEFVFVGGARSATKGL